MNNFDQSSTGTNIEFSVKYDTWTSSYNFEENMYCLRVDLGSSKPLYQYIDWGNFKKTSLDNLWSLDKRTLKKFLLECALQVDSNYWSKSEIRRMNKEELCDLIEEDMYKNGLDLEERREFADNYCLILNADNFTFFSTRGYSQGDYAEWCIRTKELEEFKNGGESLRTRIDHLFWDRPVRYQLIVDGEDYYIDEMVENRYKYDKDEVYKICEKIFKDHKDKEYILQFIADNLPEHPEEDTK